VFLVRISYIEIYNENVRDLLDTDQKNVSSVQMFEDKVYTLYNYTYWLLYKPAEQSGEGGCGRWVGGGGGFGYSGVRLD